MDRDVAVLRDRLEEAQERIRQLEELLAPSITFPVEWRLTPTERRILSALLRRQGLVHTEGLLTVVYGDDERKTGRDLAVAIFKLRRKLRPIGARIVNVWAQGFGLDEESRRIVLGHIGGTNNS